MGNRVLSAAALLVASGAIPLLTTQRKRSPFIAIVVLLPVSVAVVAPPYEAPFATLP